MMLKRLLHSGFKHAAGEKGQALAEYSLILVFIALACIVALTALGLAVSGQFDAVTGCLVDPSSCI